MELRGWSLDGGKPGTARRSAFALRHDFARLRPSCGWGCSSGGASPERTRKDQSGSFALVPIPAPGFGAGPGATPDQEQSGNPEGGGSEQDDVLCLCTKSTWLKTAHARQTRQQREGGREGVACPPPVIYSASLRLLMALARGAAPGESFRLQARVQAFLRGWECDAPESQGAVPAESEEGAFEGCPQLRWEIFRAELQRHGFLLCSRDLHASSWLDPLPPRLWRKEAKR